MIRFRSSSSNSAPPVREKLRRLLTISLARNVWLTILSIMFVAWIILRQLLGKHLNVVGDDGQRRIHFVGHARSEQAERSQFFGLEQSAPRCDPLGHVVDQNQPADALARFARQRSNGDIQHHGCAHDARSGTYRDW